MDFSAYCSKLCNITEYFDSYYKGEKQKSKKLKQKRFQVINDAMQMNTVDKIQFGQLNDKRFYFPNGIVSLPFGHFLFNDIRKLRHQNRDMHLQILYFTKSLMVFQVCIRWNLKDQFYFLFFPQRNILKNSIGNEYWKFNLQWSVQWKHTCCW